MVRLLLALTCGALLLHAAADPWDKVKALKSGAELRVYKKGSMQPMVVKMDEATDQRLVYVYKNEQSSIAREDIDRIDARPTGKRPVVKETQQSSSDTNADPRSAIPSPEPNRPVGVTQSQSTTYTMGSKPDFETVYRRPPKK